MPTTADNYSNFSSTFMAGGAGGLGTNLGFSDTTMYIPLSMTSHWPTVTPFYALLGQNTAFALGEIVKCTAISSNQLTIVRGIDGTQQAWALNSPLQVDVTSGTMADIVSPLNHALFGTFNVQDYGALPSAAGALDAGVGVRLCAAAISSNGGGVMYFPAPPNGQRYWFNTTITHPNDASIPCCVVLSSNTVVRGDGPASILSFGANLSDLTRMFVNTNVLLTLGTYNAAGSTAPTYPSSTDQQIEIRDLFINGNSLNQGSNTAMYGIDFQCARMIKLQNLIIKDVLGTLPPLAVPASGNADLCYNTGEGIGISFYSCERVEVDHCIVFADAGNSSSGFRDVETNVINYMSCTAHELNQGAGFHSASSSSVKYSNCHSFLMSATPGANGAGQGFYMDSNRDIMMTNCTGGGLTTFVGSYPRAINTSLGNAGCGLQDGGNSHMSVVNCEFSNNTQDGIQAFGGPADLVIVGGIFKNNRNGIWASGASLCVVIEGRPVFLGNTAELKNSAGTTYNLTGVLTAPGVPATTVALANPYAVPALVTISGGTVTNIQTNPHIPGGTLRGNTSIASSTASPVQAILQPFDQITLTYSAAPTWVWQSLV